MSAANPASAAFAYGWPANFHGWLAQRGMGYVWFVIKDAEGNAAATADLPLTLRSMGVVGLHLIYGTSPRGYLHACVGDAGRLQHDPHPSRSGLVNVHGVGLIFPLDPSVVVTTEVLS